MLFYKILISNRREPAKYKQFLINNLLSNKINLFTKIDINFVDYTILIGGLEKVSVSKTNF